MEPRRLVVWIAAGILGFQGGTLALDLLNCTVLSWLYVGRYGLELSNPAPLSNPSPGDRAARMPTRSEPLQNPTAREGTRSSGLATTTGTDSRGITSSAAPADQRLSVAGMPPPALLNPPRTPQAWPIAQLTPFDPTGVFCDRPRSRIDDAVSQGLSILAGLALGGSVGTGGKGGAP